MQRPNIHIDVDTPLEHTRKTPARPEFATRAGCKQHRPQRQIDTAVEHLHVPTRTRIDAARSRPDSQHMPRMGVALLWSEHRQPTGHMAATQVCEVFTSISGTVGNAERKDHLYIHPGRCSGCRKEERACLTGRRPCARDIALDRRLALAHTPMHDHRRSRSVLAALLILVSFFRASTPHLTCHCYNLLIVVSPAHMQTQIFAEHAILGLHALSLSS